MSVATKSTLATVVHKLFRNLSLKHVWYVTKKYICTRRNLLRSTYAGARPCIFHPYFSQFYPDFNKVNLKNLLHPNSIHIL